MFCGLPRREADGWSTHFGNHGELGRGPLGGGTLKMHYSSLGRPRLPTPQMVMGCVSTKILGCSTGVLLE